VAVAGPPRYALFAESDIVLRFPLRVALERDIPAVAALIPLSVRGLQTEYYSAAQMDAALGPVFGVDRELIRDRTYFIVEHEGTLVGCGGWIFGSDAGRTADDNALLDPARDPARIRAFYVHPDWPRHGIGRRILTACEQAIALAGFHSIELVATLAGEPLYAAFGYAAVERWPIALAGGLTLPAVSMAKAL
jgi:N-acetylglutamate synthase-like GNAT family acetyltransferase